MDRARKETTLMEPCYFLGDGNSANFTLDFPREGLEEDFLVEGPKKFRAHHSSLERAEWQAVRSEKVLRADVARGASID
jgi:hypothetical protein